MNYEKLIEAKIRLIELNSEIGIAVGLFLIVASISLAAFSVLRKLDDIELWISLSVMIWFFGLTIGASYSYRASNARLIAEASINYIVSTK